MIKLRTLGASRLHPVALAAAVCFATCAAPVAAQIYTSLSVSQYQSLGGFASEFNASARAVLTPSNKPGVTNLSLYGVQNGLSKHWFGTELRPAQNGRDLVGDWRDHRTGFFFATVRVTPLDHRRAVRVSFDEPMDSVATDSLAALHLGTFNAETHGSGGDKAIAGRWTTERGTVDVFEGGMHLMALITPPAGSGGTRRFVAETQVPDHATGSVLYSGRWEEIDGPGRGQATLRFPRDRQSFTGVIVEGRQSRAWNGSRQAQPSSGTPPVVTAPPRPGPVVAQPQPQIPPPGAPPTSAVGFKPVGKFAVRLDRVVAEDRYWHVYLTLKNASTGTLVQAQGIEVRFEDSEGVRVESGQALRAKPGPAELFGSPPPTTRPGGTLPVKFVFDKRTGANPAKVIVIEGDRSAEFSLG